MIRKLGIAALICATFAACGPLNRGGVGETIINAAKVITGRADPAAAEPSPEMAAAQPQDVLVVSIAALGLALPTVQIGENGAVTTWRADQGFSFSFEDGVLVATRGLGDDLIGSDTGGLAAVLGAGGGTVERAHSYLGALDQVVLRTTSCTVTNAGPEEVTTLTGGTRTLTRFNESCQGRTIAFENIYWLDDDGNIMRSQQLVSPSLAYLVTDRF